MAYNVFISYRQDGGSELGQLLYTRLTLDGYEPFFDVEKMRSGSFNKQLYDRIEECEDFLLILPPKALDPRDTDEDWVRLEIAHALKHHKNIVPVFMRNFEWPEQLPEDIAKVRYAHGAKADMDYFDAVYARIKSLLGSKPHAVTKDDLVSKHLRIAEIMLANGNFPKASESYEKILNIDPECSRAYLGQIMSQYGLRNLDALRTYYSSHLIAGHSNFTLAREYADEETRAYLESLSVPVCAAHGNAATARCDSCGELICPTCTTVIHGTSRTPAPWITGKKLCPSCVVQLRSHSKHMIRSCVEQMGGLFLFICALTAICWLIIAKTEIPAAVVVVATCALFGCSQAMPDHTESAKSEDAGLLGEILKLLFYTVFGLLYAVWVVIKHIYYLICIIRLRNAIGQETLTREELIDIYYRMVSITRGMGGHEPNW